MRNKIKTKLTFPQPSLLPRFNFTSSFLTCTFSFSSGAGEWGWGMLWFCYITLSLLLFPSRCLPSTPMWSPPNGVQSFTKCSKTLHTISTSVPWNTSSSSSSDLAVCRVISFTFISSHSCFSGRYIVPEVPPASLMAFASGRALLEWLRTGSVWCGGRSWSLTEAPPAATWLPLKWLFRFGKFSGDNLEHVSSKRVSEAGKVVEGFIAQPVYFPFSSPELCFARKANLMHLIVPQVQPGVQEVLDWSSVEWLWK